MKDLVKIGSETAKGGFANEHIIADKFNHWVVDSEAKKWLIVMGYDINCISSVSAMVLSGYKPDVQVKIKCNTDDVYTENISIKKANKDSDYNQIDKRWVDNYTNLWIMPPLVIKALKIFTGEIPPSVLLENGELTQSKYNSLRDEEKRRMFMDEMDPQYSNAILSFFKENKDVVLSDIFKGRGQFAADWILVTRHDKESDETSWVLSDISHALNVFGNGPVIMTKRGSIYIGQVTVQRKGGDGGRDTAKMLQFKASPCILFDQ